MAQKPENMQVNLGQTKEQQKEQTDKIGADCL